jgi:membrane-bound metal-dependent hydrolase YbcI (DUF457 family)
MDPVSHVAVGRTLAGLTDRRSHGYVAATVVGALSPDLDAVLMPFGWDRYLRVHEIGTHTVLGTIACALVVGGMVRFFRRSTRYGVLALLAWMGAVSHVVLDLVSSARHRPGWPLIDTVVSLPAVAMADPWLLCLCAAGAIVVIPKRSSPRWRRTAVISLGVTAGFLLIKASLGVSAFRGYTNARDTRAERVEARVIEAAWASLTTWNVLDRTPRQLRFWRARAGQPAEEIFSWPVAAETPMVRASHAFSTVRNFLRSHDLAFAVEFPRGEDRTLVLWSDIRFCWNPDAPGAPTIDPVVGVSGNRTRLACALWFGGELDPSGLPLREIVRIGRLSQERDPRP